MSGSEEKPNYYAIIPASVRYSNISANAKLLYGEITALTSKSGVCWATNDYFSRLYEKDNRTITRWLTELVNAGFIKIQDRDSVKRKLYLDKNVVVTPTKMSSNPDKNVQQNNIKNNTREDAATAVSSEEDYSYESAEAKPKKNIGKEYEEMISWLENETGVKIINTAKQKAHLKKARENNISKTRLKNRFHELRGEDFYQRHGIDWGGVVSSFDKKA